jgi:hypothetical protein
VLLGRSESLISDDHDNLIGKIWAVMMSNENPADMSAV